MLVLKRAGSVAAILSSVAISSSCNDTTRPEAADAPGTTPLHAKGGKAKPPADVQAPTIPVFSLVDVGPNHITIRYTSTDVSIPILYSVQRIGDASTWTFDNVRTYSALQPQTTYTFVAKARDNAGNWSQLSAPFNVTTTAPDPNDVTPPTAPTNVWADLIDHSAREIQVLWTPSTDNVTPQKAIIYHMYINGVLENSSAGDARTSGYGVAGTNVVTVVAVDAAGNRSSAGSYTLVIP